MMEDLIVSIKNAEGSAAKIKEDGKAAVEALLSEAEKKAAKWQKASAQKAQDEAAKAISAAEQKAQEDYDRAVEECFTLSRKQSEKALASCEGQVSEIVRRITGDR
jgi:vacuolar-type H+-ATPase subunit H